MQKLDMTIDNPVLAPNQRQGIVDLMLAREIPLHKHDEVEHLVVELKRPNVVIGKKEIEQIEVYAFAIAKDERFQGLKTRWSFWLISNEYDDYAEYKFADDSHEAGVIFRMSKRLNITIRLKTWSQILQENNHRLHYVQEKLNINIDGKKALKKLKTTYAQYFNEIDVTEGDGGGKD